MTGTFRRGHFIVEIYERTLYIRHAIAGGAWLLISAAFGRLNAVIAPHIVVIVVFVTGY